jgi:hypothetical protein
VSTIFFKLFLEKFHKKPYENPFRKPPENLPITSAFPAVSCLLLLVLSPVFARWSLIIALL